MKETDKSGTYRILSLDKVTKGINKKSASRNKVRQRWAALGLLQGLRTKNDLKKVKTPEGKRLELLGWEGPVAGGCPLVRCREPGRPGRGGALCGHPTQSHSWTCCQKQIKERFGLERTLKSSSSSPCHGWARPGGREVCPSWKHGHSSITVCFTGNRFYLKVFPGNRVQIKQ